MSTGNEAGTGWPKAQRKPSVASGSSSPSVSVDTRRSPPASSSGSRLLDPPADRRGRSNSSDHTAFPSAYDSARRGSLQNQHLDHKHYQLFQLQQLQYWERRQRLQQKTQEIEFARKTSQQQQLLQLYQQQAISQWQQQHQQHISHQRQQIQKALLLQQAEQAKKNKAGNKSRRSSAPTLSQSQTQAAKAVAAAAVASRTQEQIYHKLRQDLAMRAKLRAVANPAVALAAAAAARSAQVVSPAWPFLSRAPPATPLAHPILQTPFATPDALTAQQLAAAASQMSKASATSPTSPSAPVYPGLPLMTKEEKEWIKQIQTQSVPTGRTLEVFNSDYYYLKLCERKARREGRPAEPFIVTDGSPASEGKPQLAEGTEQASAARASSASSRATTLPGVLGGRVSSGSARFGQEILDLESGLDEPPIHCPHANKRLNESYRTLLIIEKAFDWLLELEECERMTAVPQGDGLLISQPEQREETLEKIMSSLGFRREPDLALCIDVLSTAKGVSLIARILPAVSLECAKQVALLSFQQLSLIGCGQECDIYGISQVLPALARSLAVIVKQCNLAFLIILLEHLLELPVCSDGRPGAVAVACYGGAPASDLLAAVINSGFDQCVGLSQESDESTFSRSVLYWRHLTMKLYLLFVGNSTAVQEYKHAQDFLSQLVLLAGSSFTDMFMRLDEEMAAIPSPGPGQISHEEDKQREEAARRNGQRGSVSIPPSTSDPMADSLLRGASHSTVNARQKKPSHQPQASEGEVAGSRKGKGKSKDLKKRDSITIVHLDCR